MSQVKNAKDLKPIVQEDKDKRVVVYHNGKNTMIVIEPKQINTSSEDRNG